MRRAAITFQVRPPSCRRHGATCRSVCRPWCHVPGPRCRRRRTATRGAFVSEGSCLRNLSVTRTRQREISRPRTTPSRLFHHRFTELSVVAWCCCRSPSSPRRAAAGRRLAVALPHVARAQAVPRDAQRGDHDRGVDPHVPRALAVPPARRRDRDRAEGRARPPRPHPALRRAAASGARSASSRDRRRPRRATARARSHEKDKPWRVMDRAFS